MWTLQEEYKILNSAVKLKFWSWKINLNEQFKIEIMNFGGDRTP